MKKLLVLTVVMGLGLVLLTGCSGKNESSNNKKDNNLYIYNDGVYEGRSHDDERGNYGIVVLEIKNDKIVNAEFKGYLPTGAEKDINYGKVIDEKTGEPDIIAYEKAQKALEGNAGYGPKLVEIQDIDNVDIITGATRSHGQFGEAVNDALAKAKK